MLIPCTEVYRNVVTLQKKYAFSRNTFDQFKGILTPIRGVVFTDNGDTSVFEIFSRFCLQMFDKGVVFNINENDDWETVWDSLKPKETIIGYMAACRIGQDKIPGTGWSMIAPQDCYDELWNPIYGKYLAIERALSNARSSYLNNAHDPQISIYAPRLNGTRCYEQYGGVIYIFLESLSAQRDKFITRCKNYYKTDTIYSV